VPVPSSVNVTDVREAISAAIVVIELELTPVEVPIEFVAVTENV
jgi:hypothetical protein